MNMRRVFLFLFSAIVLSLVVPPGAFCAAPVVKAPPPPDITFPLPAGGLLSEDKKEIDARIDWWYKLLTDARIEDDVIESREKLLEDYNRYHNLTYETYFAKKCNVVFMPLMSGKVVDASSPLRKVIRINAAKALGEMKRVALVPCYMRMVSDSNQALKYLGWQAFFSVREKIFNGRPQDIAIFTKGVSRAVQVEKNPIIVNVILAIMDFESQENEPIRGRYTPEIKKMFLAAYKAAIPSWRRLIVGATEDDTWKLDTVPRILDLVGDICRTLAGDKKVRTECLQLIVDMGDSAADRVMAFQPPDGDSKLMISLQGILTKMEEQLNVLTGAKKPYMKNALKQDVAIGAAVKEAVAIKWIKDLSADGVVRPKPPVVDKPEPKPKPKPESKPATKPASAPAKKS
jgi:hypothetical protein